MKRKKPQALINKGLTALFMANNANFNRNSLSLRIMHLLMALGKATVATAGGGCGRPANVRIVLPVSAMSAVSTRTALMSTEVVVPFAPLCGSI